MMLRFCVRVCVAARRFSCGCLPPSSGGKDRCLLRHVYTCVLKRERYNTDPCLQRIKRDREFLWQETELGGGERERERGQAGTRPIPKLAEGERSSPTPTSILSHACAAARTSFAW